MQRRKQYSAQEKLKHIKEFLAKEYSYGEMTAERGIAKTTMQRWIVSFEKEGNTAFQNKRAGNSNTNRIKLVPAFNAKEYEGLMQRIERL